MDIYGEADGNYWKYSEFLWRQEGSTPNELCSQGEIKANNWIIISAYMSPGIRIERKAAKKNTTTIITTSQPASKKTK